MRRVVVTGLGCVSPCGNNVKETWENVKNGVTGIDKITLFDASQHTVQIAGEVKNFSLDEYNLDRKLVRKMARSTKFLVGASMEAVKDAGFTLPSETDKGNFGGPKCGIVTGVGIGTNDACEDAYKRLLNPAFGATKVPPMTAPMIINNEAAANVSILLNMNGPAWTLSTACSSGTDAIGLSCDMIKSGRVDVCLASGADANITALNLSAYTALTALATGYNDNPKAACRPFDRDRCGFIMAEGAAVLVLEDYDHAVARGARIYAEVAGCASTSDAYHITAPCTDGHWGAEALKMALEQAGMKPEEIQYYNAHGTSTHANDSSESQLVKTVFGDYAKDLHISSTKSETGHMIGAAGAIEALFCVKAIEEGFVPPTINLENPDVEGGCDLNYTPKVGVKCDVTAAASVSLGFGGHNGAVVLKKI